MEKKEKKEKNRTIYIKCHGEVLMTMGNYLYYCKSLKAYY